MASPAFPTVVGYFEQLPNGWASFPDCVVRSSLLGPQRDRGALDDSMFDEAPSALRPLAAYIAPSSRWVPEVAHVAIVLALRDARFGPTADDETEFLEWMAKVNRDLLAEPALAAAIPTDGPRKVLPRFPALWAEFHVGAPLTVERLGETSALLALHHPAELYHRLTIETHRRTLAVAITMTGAVQLTIEAKTIFAGPHTRTELACRWS